MPLSSLMLLRHRPILAIWAAQLLSQTGDRFFALAIMWVALQRSGPVAMGAVAIAESIPFIVMGAVGHRLLRRCASFGVLAGIDAVRALLVAGLPWVWATGGMPTMLGVVLVLGVFGAVFDPALGALVPDLVNPHKYLEAVALMDLTSRIARIAGPGLAGVLLMAAPITRLFTIDAATFAVSAATLVVLVRMTTGSGARWTRASSATQSTEYVRARSLLREYPYLSTVFAVQTVGFFLMALPAIGLPLLLARQLDAGPAAYGWLLTACGVASVAGSLAASHAVGGVFPVRFCMAWVVIGVLQVAIGSVGTVLWVSVFATMAGFVNAIIGIAMGTHLVSFEPPQRLRLLAVNYMVMRGAGTAGMVVVPALIASTAARGFVVGGTVLILSAAAGALLAASKMVAGKDH
ncbi:hypothetical protein GFY24_40070 [Nocardia sp. SYP-A9097]|uniref:MFS transporter n=1 Tax=Nocardia sp. SYP-A9097 TaxID=2663237 RepID=UPI00129B1655|nr:MFS transporter [Nocardia sp. SYP-A9097]MRH93525.1 hypothetical protein [Nocardia sp. SYP-A9097]